MISTMLPSATKLGLFISVFILIAPDGIFSLNTIYVEEDTSSRLSCKHNVPDHEFHRVKWFKSTNDDVYENGRSALVSWDNTSDPIITDDNYSIYKDFSLVIRNTSIAKGIYRCSVTRNIPGDFQHYDVKVISYGKVNPADTSPAQYGTYLRINCSSNSTRDSKVSVLWYKGESRDCFKSDDQPIASWIDGRPDVSPDYTLNDDFSLDIQNVSNEYEGVYRSIVVSKQEPRPLASDTHVKVYGKVKPVHKSPVQYGKHLRINCSSNSTRDSKVAVLWYKRNSTGILNRDEKPIASWINGKLDVSPDYTLNDDFSLGIQNVSNEYEAVYRSIVVSTQEARPSAVDTNVTVYALPREVPFIRHFFQNGLCFINCSVNHVYPLLYPEFPELNFLSNNQTYEIQNEDGTFNTSISGNVIQYDHSITVKCTFPHFGYRRNSSKHIVNLSVKDEVPHPPGSSDHNPATFAILTALGITTLIILVNAFAVYAWKRRIKKHQQNDVDKSLPEIEPMV